MFCSWLEQQWQPELIQRTRSIWSGTLAGKLCLVSGSVRLPGEPERSARQLEGCLSPRQSSSGSCMGTVALEAQEPKESGFLDRQSNISKSLGAYRWIGWKCDILSKVAHAELSETILDGVFSREDTSDHQSHVDQSFHETLVCIISAYNRLMLKYADRC